MMTHLLFLALLFNGNTISSENQIGTARHSELKSEIARISKVVTSLRASNAELQRTVSAQQKKIDILSVQLAESHGDIAKLVNSTNVTISEISSDSKTSQSQIQEIDQAITKRTLYWAITIITLGLLGILSFVIFRRRLSAHANGIDSKIAVTESALEKLKTVASAYDADLAQILQTQLELIKEKRGAGGTADTETNHKLPLKVGDEIHRMRKRIENMPPDVKGLGALRNSLTRLEEVFNENGYSFEQLAGRRFTPEMNVEARFVEHEGVPVGEEIIIDVLRPQIMYKDRMIQPAKVEVGKSF